MKRLCEVNHINPEKIFSFRDNMRVMISNKYTPRVIMRIGGVFDFPILETIKDDIYQTYVWDKYKIMKELNLRTRYR